MTEETLFERAYQLPAAERSGFLDRECGGDPALRARVDALLVADAAPHSPLDAPAGPPMDATATFGDPAATSQDSAGNEAEGTVIAGRYKLSERIGEGGMGSVYLAHQSAPVKRKVAVKLIKAGMDSKAVLARFDAERQALAMMDHPSIAKVLDGGLHDGRPFFVMELVKGVPITEYCDKRKLTPKERLELFVPVCHAIQHAHQKGIIHRDIKPSNVLVALYDDRPVPKVIDFGVAKATGGSLTEHTIETAFGGVVGTPQYMSPEQASLNNLDIDTRSDVYSLGVLLYELLTGSPPFAPKELEKRGLLEILRVVREEEPPRPSTKLSTADALPSLSASRSTEPKKLTGLLRNELDWIVMKALEKDRARRYETANGFAADVHRYLNGEAVQAHPPSTAYRVKKFVRRNKGQVIAASLVLLALLAGMAGTTWGLFAARQAQERESQRADGEQKAKDDAVASQLRAEKAYARTADVLDTMVSDVAGDSLATQKAISAEQKKFLTEVLTYYREFAGEKAEDPKTRLRAANAASSVGQIESRLGHMEEAVAATLSARDGYAALAAEFPAVPIYRQNLANSHNCLGIFLKDLGKRLEAEEHTNKAMAILEKLSTEFPAVPLFRQELAVSHNILVILLEAQGKGQEAVEHSRKATAILEKLVTEFPAVPVYRQDLGMSHHNLGCYLRDMGKRPEATEQFRKALDIQEKLAAEFPAVSRNREALAWSYNNLGILQIQLGQQSEALEHFRKGLAVFEKMVADFPAVPEYRVDLGGGYCNYGNLVSVGGKLTDGLEWFSKAINTLAPVYEREPRDVLAKEFLRNSYQGRAFVHDRLQQYAEAIPDIDKAIEYSPEEEKPQYRAPRANALFKAGRVAEAVSEVAELTKLPGWDAGNCYSFACVYAVASGKMADKKDEYAKRAVELLQRAVKAGYKDAAHMKQDTDLDPLREREDFQQLMAELEAMEETK